MWSLTIALLVVIIILIYIAGEQLTDALPPLEWPGQPSSLWNSQPIITQQSAPAPMSAQVGSSSEPAEHKESRTSATAGGSATRGLGSVDVNTDISTFDFAGAAARSRGSDSAPGGASSAATVTGGNIVAPIVDQAPVVVSQIPLAAPPPTAIASPTIALAAAASNVATATLPTPGAERPDYRCGPSAGNAKCGVGRCCSIFGWCGSAGEDHCKPGINAPAYNGPNAPLACTTPPALSCSGAAALDSAKYYYEAAGPGKGLYVMKPLSGVAGPGPNTCNVGYQYLDASGQVVGSDTRTFTYMQDGCIWRAYQVASSGTGSAIIK